MCCLLVARLVGTRAGTNTPSDEYDSYREYRVANTNNVFANTVIRFNHAFY